MRRARALSVALAVGLALTGCGSVSEEYEIAGIDELEIPTASPDPGDFVATIDNPWLPYAAGNVWTYDVEGEFSGRRTVTVADETEVVAGVDVVVVVTEDHEEGSGWEATAFRRDFYAQDREGNVWWFGSDGEWEAGVDGAEAGLAMPADPRVGDGWRLALRDGVVEDRATVESVEDGQVVLLIESELAPDGVVQRTYDTGVGLTRTFNLEGPTGSSLLVSGP
jgi:hypothetical protein